jgi:hypothetical protein
LAKSFVAMALILAAVAEPAHARQHRQEHAAVARLSRNGRLVVAEQSRHHVQLDEPELVVTIIRQVVNAARK